MKEYGFLNEDFSPYFWEDSEFSCRLMMNGLKNYTSTDIILCHGTDERHLQRKKGKSILESYINEYRARVLFDSTIENSQPQSIYNNLDRRVINIAEKHKLDRKDFNILARYLGIHKGLAQIGCIIDEYENRNNVFKNLKDLNKILKSSNTRSELLENNAVVNKIDGISKSEMSLDLKKYFRVHNLDECILLCNGPSLRNTNIGALRALDIPIIASNSSYILAKELDLMPTYFVCEDNHVIVDNLDEIKQLSGCQKFVPDKYFKHFGKLKDMHYLPTNWDAYFKSKSSYQNPDFSKDISKIAYVGQTVTYLMLQLAYYMGFKRVNIVGLDFSYKIPRGSKISVNSIDHDDDDPNHFHKDYFGKGKQWHFPKLDSCLQSYIKADSIYSESNRSIVNCSTHSKLNTFRSSNTIQGINIKSSSDKNLEIDTFLDSYFNCSLNEKKYLESWSEDQLQQYWESFAEEKNIIFYSKNKMFYKLNNNEMIHSYPFLSSFDSTSNVKYINLDLKEDLFTLDKYINANMLLFGLNTKRQSFNKTFVGNLIKEVRDIHDHFCLIKRENILYIKLIQS